MGSSEALPFWQVNVPESQRVDTCPEFLAGLNEKDRSHLSLPDSLYQTQDWDEVRQIVKENRLEAFRRIPSELRRYKAYTWKLAQDHGSVLNYMVNERLAWKAPIIAKGTRPFELEEDYKILYNDWPYGLDPCIVHLVVWTKFNLEEDPNTGDVTDEARQAMRDFMLENFLKELPEDQVIWFKNWAALKSVDAVEHFHVMLYDPDPDFVKRITNGDIPQSQKPDL